MRPELHWMAQLFIPLARSLQQEPQPPMGDSFEEWLFWLIPAQEKYRSSRQGVAKVEAEASASSPLFDLVLWQSLLEYPDFVLEREGSYLGIECKSLEASAPFLEMGQGMPCRTTIDFNSTVPCGQERYRGKFVQYAPLRGQAIPVFYALGLYGEVDGEDRVLSVLFVDGNYINRDCSLHQAHRNISRDGFGSYGDGGIRERKMYIFPNPMTDPDLVGTVSLVAEGDDLTSTYPDLDWMMTKVRRTPAGEEHPFQVYRLQVP